MMKRVIVCLLVMVLLVPALSACQAASGGPLPRSLKGYELYSWQEEDQWHFTLITGTNRGKSLEEIVSGENTVAEWVRIHAAGVEETKAVLSRIPENETVVWNNGQRVVSAQPAANNLTLPPADIIKEIKAHAEKCGLDFYVDTV